MWLRGRLDTAERGRDQLDRKLRILIPELHRLETRLYRREEAWAAAWREAQTWLLRAGLLGGQDAIRNASTAQPADVEISWISAMGLTYPEDAVISPAAVGDRTVPGNAAIVPAAHAFRVALLAGARVAATQEAVRRLDHEIAVTRRRMRALDTRWLPWLHHALGLLELTLEQAELEDGMRLRRAASTPWSGGPPDDRTHTPGR
jgi:V/A-type H+-transporting ATPase subunit D